MFKSSGITCARVVGRLWFNVWFSIDLGLEEFYLWVKTGVVPSVYNSFYTTLNHSLSMLLGGFSTFPPRLIKTTNLNIYLEK